MNCEVCPVDRIARPATKRVAFKPREHFAPNTPHGDVFFTCAGCAETATNTTTATITDIPQEAPNG